MLEALMESRTAMELVSLLIGGLVSALLLAVGHWFPWPRRLTRMEAYGYGTVSIWAGFALWRLVNGDWVTPAGLVVIVTVSGLTVMGTYRLDWMMLAVRKASRAEAVDDELSVEE